MLARARITSFLAGFGLASAAAVFKLSTDVHESHRVLADQVRREGRGGGEGGEA